MESDDDNKEIKKKKNRDNLSNVKNKNDSMNGITLVGNQKIALNIKFNSVTPMEF